MWCVVRTGGVAECQVVVCGVNMFWLTPEDEKSGSSREELSGRELRLGQAGWEEAGPGVQGSALGVGRRVLVDVWVLGGEIVRQVGT